MIEHQGDDMDCGHYVAYCRRAHSWYLFDDCSCTNVTLREVLAAQAFVLLYRRENDLE